MNNWVAFVNKVKVIYFIHEKLPLFILVNILLSNIY